MKKEFFITFLLTSLVLVGGCVSCEKPYIKVGNECCLDNNENKICDKDEIPIQEYEAIYNKTGELVRCTIVEDCYDYLLNETIDFPEDQVICHAGVCKAY